MHECGESRRQRDRDTRRHQRALAGREDDGDRGHEVGARVAGMRVSRHRRRRVDPPDQDLDHAASSPSGLDDPEDAVPTWRGTTAQRTRAARWQAVPMAQSADAAGPAEYRERLTAPLSWWGLALLFALAVGWAFFVATPRWVAAVAFLVGLAVSVGLVATYGRAAVEVSEAGIRAGRALLPWSAVGS